MSIGLILIVLLVALLFGGRFSGYSYGYGYGNGGMGFIGAILTIVIVLHFAGVF